MRRVLQCAHFGKPAQPYSAEALAYLTQLVLHRDVKVEMLSKDQYSRIVSTPDYIILSLA